MPIELPGRGERLDEPLLVDIHLMAEDVFNQIKKNLYKPYIFFGHSMGGILSYLVAKRIKESGLPLPLHLLVTGCEGPSADNTNKKLRSQLPRDKFIEELKELGGVPQDVLQNESFLVFFEPILRADFRSKETYVYKETDPLDLPITVMYGSDEDITVAGASAWQKESTVPIEMFELQGDHFFIFNNEKYIMEMILKKIAQRGYSVKKLA
jgi:surfactin synthase thioesterase subunit